MMTRFRSLSTTDTLGKAVDELLAGSQQDFPVIDHDLPVGLLRRNDLVKALSENRRDARVEDFMCRDCDSVDSSDSLNRTVESMHARQWATLVVTHAGRVVGLLTLENVSEMILINHRRDVVLAHACGPTEIEAHNNHLYGKRRRR
jgi:predicted transcriptional regulator